MANIFAIYSSTSIGSANQIIKTNGAGTANEFGLVANANVDPSAAIAGSKINPDFGAQNIKTTGTVKVGVTPATTGTIGISHNNTIYGRNAANLANYKLFDWGTTTTNTLITGDSTYNAVYKGSAITYQVETGNAHTWQVNGTNVGILNSSALLIDGYIGVGQSLHSSLGNLRFDAKSADVTISFHTGSDLYSYIVAKSDRSLTIGGAGGIILANGVSAGSLISAKGVIQSSSAGITTGMNSTSLYFTSSVATPRTISIIESTTATFTGSLLTINSQDCSGTTAVTAGSLMLRAGDATGASGTRNGGNLIARAGAGATANGYLELQNATGTKSLNVNDINVAVDGDLTADSLDTSSGTAPTGAGVGLLNNVNVTWAGASSGSAGIKTDTDNDLTYTSVAGHIHTVGYNGYSGGISDGGSIRITGSDDTPFTFDIPTPNNTEGVITIDLMMRSLNGAHNMVIKGITGYTNDAGSLSKKSDSGIMDNSGSPADTWLFVTAASGGSLRLTFTGSTAIGILWITGSWAVDCGPYMGSV